MNSSANSVKRVEGNQRKKSERRSFSVFSWVDLFSLRISFHSCVVRSYEGLRLAFIAITASEFCTWSVVKSTEPIKFIALSCELTLSFLNNAYFSFDNYERNVLVVFNLRFLIGHIPHVSFVWIFLLIGILGKWKMFLQYGQV